MIADSYEPQGVTPTAGPARRQRDPAWLPNGDLGFIESLTSEVERIVKTDFFINTSGFPSLSSAIEIVYTANGYDLQGLSWSGDGSKALFDARSIAFEPLSPRAVGLARLQGTQWQSGVLTDGLGNAKDAVFLKQQQGGTATPSPTSTATQFCLSQAIDSRGLNIRSTPEFPANDANATSVNNGVLRITGVYAGNGGRWLRVDPHVPAGVSVEDAVANPNALRGWVWEDVFLSPCADGSSVDLLPTMDTNGNIIQLPSPTATPTPSAPPPTPSSPNAVCTGVYTANPSNLRREPYTDMGDNILVRVENYQPVDIYSRFDYGSVFENSTIWYEVGFTRANGERVYGWLHQAVLDGPSLANCGTIPAATFATRTPAPTLTPIPSPTSPPDLSSVFPLPMAGLGGEPARLSPNPLGCAINYIYKIPSRDIVPLGRADEGHPVFTPANATVIVLDRLGVLADDPLTEGRPGVFISIRIDMVDIPQQIQERLATLNAIPQGPEFANIPVNSSGSIHIGYSHLQVGSIPLDLEVGDTISANTLIGRTGSTGAADGSHLDLAIFYIPDYPTPLDAAHFNSYGNGQTFRPQFEYYWDAFWTMYDEAYRRPSLYGSPVVINPLVLWPSLQEGAACSFY